MAMGEMDIVALEVGNIRPDVGTGVKVSWDPSEEQLEAVPPWIGVPGVGSSVEAIGVDSWERKLN